MSVNKKRAQNILNKYIKLLNLGRFDITLKFEKEDNKNGAAGECRIDYKYLWAEVTLFPCAFIKPNDLEHIIVHELCHIIVDPLYLYCFDLMNGRFRTGDQIENERENAVEMITKAVLKKVKE